MTTALRAMACRMAWALMAAAAVGAIAWAAAVAGGRAASGMRPDARLPGRPPRPGEVRGPSLRRFVEGYTIEHRGEPGGVGDPYAVADE